MTHDEPTPNPPEFSQSRMTHCLFLAMASAVLLLSFLMSSDGRHSVSLPGFSAPLPEMCTAKAYFGFSCPGCGLTRSFIAISQGKWSQAWQLNPASFLVYAFVGLQIPWQLFQLFRIQRQQPVVDTIWIFAPLLVCITAMLAQWIIKLSVGIHVT